MALGYKVKVKLVAQSCTTLCNTADCDLPGSSVHGILQARILEWVAISFSRESSRPRDRTWVFCIAGRYFTIWATTETPTGGKEGSKSRSKPDSVSFWSCCWNDQLRLGSAKIRAWTKGLSVSNFLGHAPSSPEKQNREQMRLGRFGDEDPDSAGFCGSSGGESSSVVSDSLRSHGLYSPWNFPGQNTGVGSLSLLQWIFPTQELNWGLLHCRRILYQLSYQGSPRGALEGASRPSPGCWSFHTSHWSQVGGGGSQGNSQLSVSWAMNTLARTSLWRGPMWVTRKRFTEAGRRMHRSGERHRFRVSGEAVGGANSAASALTLGKLHYQGTWFFSLRKKDRKEGYIKWQCYWED